MDGVHFRMARILRGRGLKKGVLCVAVAAVLAVLYIKATAPPNTVNRENSHRPNIVRQAQYIQADRTVGSDHTSDTAVSQRFKRRLDTLHAACRLYANSSLFRSKAAGFHSIPPHRPLMNVTARYCPIAKTSATTWQGVFASIRQEFARRGVTPGNASKGDEEVYFTFVREPYGRMLSAWTDKLLTPNPLFWKITGRHIVKTFREAPTEQSLKCGHDVTFPEFVKYFIHSQQTGINRNGHFIPTHDQCDTCIVPYKYIGHLETISEDLPHILQAVHAPVGYTRSYDSDTIRQNINMVLLKDRQREVKKCMSLDEACRRLWKKFQIRGLISKTELFPLTPKETEDITALEFQKVALAGMERSQDNSARKLQKKEALREAFATVPLSDRLEVQKLLFLDFEMFGFNPRPEEVFPSVPYEKDGRFSYFDVMDN